MLGFVVIGAALTMDTAGLGATGGALSGLVGGAVVGGLTLLVSAIAGRLDVERGIGTGEGPERP